MLIFQQTLGGLAFPISKFGLELIEPFTFAFYRFLISVTILLVIVKRRKQNIPIEKSDWPKIIGLGILIIPINQVLYLYGQSLTAAGHGSLLFATTPIWIYIAAMIHLKEKIRPRRLVGIIVAMAGVLVIMSSGAVKFGNEYLLGDFIILIAVIAWAYYTIFGKELVQKYGALRITAYALGTGTLLYLPFGIYKAAMFDYSHTSLGAWAAVFYMAVGTSILVYVLWYWVLKYMEATRLAVFHNIQPIVATSVAFIWLGEPVGIYFVAGGSIAILGLVIAEYKSS